MSTGEQTGHRMIERRGWWLTLVDPVTCTLASARRSPLAARNLQLAARNSEAPAASSWPAPPRPARRALVCPHKSIKWALC